MSEANEERPPFRLAYVISRFPLASETFILRELEALRDRGWSITLIPLVRHHSTVEHREATPWKQEAWFTPFLSPSIILANLCALVVRPSLYLSVWRDVLRGTWSCPNYLVGALGIVPKSVYLAGRVRQTGIRHVHAHYISHPAVAAMVIARLAGVSFSVTAHAHDLLVHQNMLTTKIHRASFVATISEFNRRFIAQQAGVDSVKKTHVVRCGVDLKMFVPTPLPPGCPYRILSVASLQPYKGLTYLVKACAILRVRRHDFECRIIGEGELQAALEAEIKAFGLEQHVRLLGPQPQHVVVQEMARAHVFVLPSIVEPSGKMEGVPVALMEALASGRPVVATRISGIPELVRHEQTGLLVEPEDAPALAEALSRLAEDHALGTALASKGRQLVEREFNLRANVRLLEEYFQASVSEAGW